MPFDPQAFAIIQRQFQDLVGTPLELRRTNDPDLRLDRQDALSYAIADAVVRDPPLGARLVRAAARWVERCDCETTRAIAGYAAYLSQDYARAANWFLSCVALNPRNLDNWIDLAFALNHVANPLGRHLLFNLDEYAARFAALGERLCTLSRLEALRAQIEAEGADYKEVWRGFVGG